MPVRLYSMARLLARGCSRYLVTYTWSCSPCSDRSPRALNKRTIKREYSCSRCSRRSKALLNHVCTNCSTRWLRVGDRVFEMCEKNSSRQASVRERYFHLGARDRKVAREPESGGRALLPCPMAHATRHARAVSRARATAARTPKSFPALVASSSVVRLGNTGTT